MMRSWKAVTRVAVLAALLTTTSLGAANARDLRIASSSALNYELYDPVYTTFMSELSRLTDGDMTARHYGLEIVNLRNAVTSLESGLVDVANFLPTMVPADFPNAALLGELALLGNSGPAMSAAVMEYLTSCVDCQAEFDRKGFVYTASVATPPYELLMAGKPVSTPEDLAGMRIRSPGTAYSLWIRAMGAIPTEVTITEEYEALQGGLIDGTVAPTANLIGSRLLEVANYYTPIPIGTYHATSSFTVRKDLWQSLSLDEKAKLVQAAVTAVAFNDPAMRATGTRGLEEFDAKGGQTVAPSTQLIAASAGLRDRVVAAAIEAGESRYGIADADEKVTRFVELVDKWDAIMEPIQDDPGAIAAAVQDGIWSKVDLETYAP